MLGLMLQLTLTLCAQNNSTMALFTHCQRRTKLRTEVLPTICSAAASTWPYL